MPINTMFDSVGKDLSEASRSPRRSWLMISCVSSDRIRPMAPVEQNEQARAHPTWVMGQRSNGGAWAQLTLSQQDSRTTQWHTR